MKSSRKVKKTEKVTKQIYVDSCCYTVLEFRKSFLELIVPGTSKRQLYNKRASFITIFRIYLTESTRTYENLTEGTITTNNNFAYETNSTWRNLIISLSLYQKNPWLYIRYTLQSVIIFEGGKINSNFWGEIQQIQLTEGFFCNIFASLFFNLQDKHYETRKSVFYFTSKLFSFSRKSNFRILYLEVSWHHQMSEHKTRNICFWVTWKVMKFDQFNIVLQVILL